MPSDAGHEALVHIRYHIELIGRFVEGYDFERFADDPRTFHAVIPTVESIDSSTAAQGSLAEARRLLRATRDDTTR